MTTSLGSVATGDYFAKIANSVSIPLVVQDASSYVGAPIDLSVYLNLLEQFGVGAYFLQARSQSVRPKPLKTPRCHSWHGADL